MNFHHRGNFSNFERARSAGSRIAENIEVVNIIYCRPSDVFGLPYVLCIM